MENKEAAKYIECIEIKGLWGRYDVDWQLHSDVNILVGENGTGKTTILKLASEMLGQNMDTYPNDMESTKAKLQSSYNSHGEFAILIKLIA